MAKFFSVEELSVNNDLTTHRTKTAFSALVLILIACVSPLLAQTNIRIMAANTTSGNGQSYLDPGDRIFKGLKPDVVLVQEFKIGASGARDATSTTNWVNATFGSDFSWTREPGGENIPNGVISRWPIIASGQIADNNVADRDFSWARIDIPGDKDLWAVSVHLLTSGSGVRNTQANVLVSGLNALNIPATDYVVIGGDFNTDNFSESCLSTLRSYLSLTTSTDLRPRDQNSNQNTNANRNKPYDQVLARSNLNTLQVPTVVGTASYPNGLVFDSRVFTPLSAVSPVVFSDSAATNMQHMAVMKDFLIPAGTGTGTGTDFSVSGNAVDFGVQNATQGPFQNSTILLNVTTPFTLSGVSFMGSQAQEFELLSPSLPSTISSQTPLVFRWSPASNNNVSRAVSAGFTTNGNPASFSVSLTGTPRQAAQTSNPINLSGYTLRQFNSSVTYTIPTGTMLEPQQTLVIARNADRAAFQTFWNTTLSDSVVFLNATATGTEFPQINGAETYTLSNVQNQQIDPPGSGDVPEDGLSSSQRARRVIVNATVFQASSASLATPGNPEVTSLALGDLVITEVSDALGSGNFIYEFVELYYDAEIIVAPAEPTSWIFF